MLIIELIEAGQDFPVRLFILLQKPAMQDHACMMCLWRA